MPSYRFLQFSDLHSGRGIRGHSLRLSDQQRRTLRQDRLDCLETIVDLAIEEGVEVVLIPGDLFEEDRVRTAEVQRIRRALEALRPTPVVISPGRYDYYSPLSWYRRDVMRKHQLEPWPEHVQIFTESNFHSLRVGGTGSLRVTGRAHGGREDVSRCSEEMLPNSGTDTMDLLMLHGSIDPGVESANDETLDRTEQDICDVEVAYTALGGLHSHYAIQQEETVRGGYAGAPMPVSDLETGEGRVLIGQLTAEGVPASSLEKRDVSPRRLHELEIEPGRETSAARFRRRVQKRLEEETVKPEDIVRLTVRGTHPGHEVLESDLLQSLRNEYFHVELDVSRTRPVVSSDVLDEEGAEEHTTEDRFVQEMLNRINDASSEEQKEISRKALRIGLSAFRTEDVRLDHVL